MNTDSKDKIAPKPQTVKPIVGSHLIEQARELLRLDKAEFRMHILGPDDMIPFPDELTALREANAVNIW